METPEAVDGWLTEQVDELAAWVKDRRTPMAVYSSGSVHLSLQALLQKMYARSPDLTPTLAWSWLRVLCSAPIDGDGGYVTALRLLADESETESGECALWFALGEIGPLLLAAGMTPQDLAHPPVPDAPTLELLATLRGWQFPPLP